MSSKIMLCSVPCNIPCFVLCILFADISVYCVAFVDMNMVLRWLVWRESGSSIASFSGVWRLPMSFCFPSLFVCFVLFFCFCFGLCSIVKQYRSTLSRSPSVSSIHSPWVFTPRFHFLVFFLFLFSSFSSLSCSDLKSVPFLPPCMVLPIGWRCESVPQLTMDEWQLAMYFFLEEIMLMC